MSQVVYISQILNVLYQNIMHYTQYVPNALKAEYYNKCNHANKNTLSA